MIFRLRTYHRTRLEIHWLRASLVIALALGSRVHAQSLGDLARKAAEERAKAKQEETKPDTKSENDKATDKSSAVKVYSNRDLVSVPPPSTTVARHALHLQRSGTTRMD
jgi:hypothetical protein